MARGYSAESFGKVRTGSGESIGSVHTANSNEQPCGQNINWSLTGNGARNIC
jgi:hypothetical protein